MTQSRGHRLARSLDGFRSGHTCMHGSQIFARLINVTRYAWLDNKIPRDITKHDHPAVDSRPTWWLTRWPGLVATRARDRHRNATPRQFPKDKRIRYLLHDYLRGDGTLACASSSLNYRLILLVFWSVEVIQTSSLRASWTGNVRSGFHWRHRRSRNVGNGPRSTCDMDGGDAHTREGSRTCVLGASHARDSW
jgi:hypothetical protein